MSTYLPISIPLPPVHSKEHLALFEKCASYKYRIPEVRHLRNVFVSYDGIVLKSGRLIRGAAFNTHGHSDNNFGYTFWKKAMEQYLVCRFGKSLPSIKLDSGSYFIIHTKWFNYAFWMTSSLSRLILAERHGVLEKAQLLLPENIAKNQFVVDTLTALNMTWELVPEGKHLFIRDFYLPETRDWSTEYSGIELSVIRERLIPIALQKTQSFIPKGNKLYLSRKKRGVRSIKNEAELESLLSKHGFETIYFEDYSVWEQITMMQTATHFVSIHGAGCTNIMFMKPGCTFIELINEPYAKEEYKFPFWKIASLSGLTYYPVFCKVDAENTNFQLGMGMKKNNDEHSFLVNQDVLVDLEQLEQLIQP